MRKGFIIKFYWLILFFLVNLSVQASDIPIMQFRKANHQEDLGDKGAKSVAQDCSGSIWFNTANEICRSEMRNINEEFCLSNNSNRSIGADILKEVWIGTNLGALSYLLYFLFIILVFVLVQRTRRVRIDYLTQLKMERISKEKMNDLNNMKIQFFTNISHEFKTPLTLISAPLKKLLQSVDEDDENSTDLELIHRSVLRLQNLINQLMIFRSIDTNELKIDRTEGDVVSFLKDISLLFLPLIEELNIKFIFDSSTDHYISCFDHDKYEKIFFNLISNAVKYTNPEGHIIVDIQIEKCLNGKETSVLSDTDNRDLLTVSIINTGVITNSDKLESILENHYKIGNYANPVQHSSGIGLALAKELIHLLEGRIDLHSTEKDTCFKVQLPLRPMKTVSTDEVDESMQSYEFCFTRESVVHQLSQKVIDASNYQKNEGKPIILLVEDNVDMQNFLYQLLTPEFYVYTASDGAEGLRIAKDIDPEIIITDILMPKMTGVDLCDKLKSNKSFSHIPVMLLSALSGQENLNDGMKAGADVYIEKPFDPEYLVLQVRNLISSREAVRKAFLDSIDLVPERVPITSTDGAFLKRAIKSVEDQMSNSEYNVDQFVNDMALSRTLLYKKIKSLTGLSINEFIVNIRMKRAAQLLRDSEMTVSEIAYEVGFNEPKYFSTCFKKFFHVSPSKYTQHLIKDEILS